MQAAASVTLDVLPAQEGDALLLACRGRDRVHHVLIDAGTPSTAPAVLARLQAIPDRRLDLLVVTHIDSDHIGGMAKLLANPAFDLKVDDAWFNGYKHLPGERVERGVADAERLTAVLTGASTVRMPWSRLRRQAVLRPDDLPDGSR
jgi:glyoxylase-like metal-dependent hydrolase (beta-lactamase superfamily II)